RSVSRAILPPSLNRAGSGAGSGGVGGRDEYLRTIHSTADSDDAAHYRRGAGGHSGISIPPCVSTAASGFPHHFGFRSASRSEPGNDGLVRRHTTRAAVRENRRGDRND